jgi:hypothetical protein
VGPVDRLLASEYAQYLLGVSVEPSPELALLGDPDMLTALIAALGEARMTAREGVDAAHRQRLLRLIGRAAVWTGSRRAVQALCDHAAVERYPLVAAEALAVLREPFAWLMPLREVVGELDPALLLSLTGADHPVVRAAATEAMWWVPADVAWPVLDRNVTAETRVAQAAIRAAGLLGGDRLAPFLVAATNHADKDVVTSAASAVLDAAGSDALPLVRQVAPRMERWALCQALARHGEAADVPVVADRMKFVVAQQKVKVIPWEGITLLPFLHRHRDQRRAAAAIAAVRQHVDSLEPSDRAWLGLFLPGFEDLAPEPVPIPSQAADGVAVTEFRMPADPHDPAERWPCQWRARLLRLGEHPNASWIDITVPSGGDTAMTLAEVEARHGSTSVRADDRRVTDPLGRPPWMTAATH